MSKKIYNEEHEIFRDTFRKYVQNEIAPHLEEWEEKVQSLERKISRLGPINLAAIGEYEEHNERKEYLDRQHDDLMNALELLESAIRKIDKETKDRFEDIFENVNSHLQGM